MATPPTTMMEVVGLADRPAEGTSATALFRDDDGDHELQIVFHGEHGCLTATLAIPDLDATGHCQATLVKASPYSTILAATVDLTGYDVNNDRFRDLEVSIGATWTINRCDPTALDLAGTALITDLSTRTLTRLRAVRHHPFNQIKQVDGPTDPLPHGPDRPKTVAERRIQHPFPATDPGGAPACPMPTDPGPTTTTLDATSHQTREGTMKTLKPTDGPLAGLVHSSQATIHNLTDHVRATAERPRRLLDARRRNELLRELGQLHYDAHQTGNAPNLQSVDRLISQLDAEYRDAAEHDEAGDGDR